MLRFPYGKICFIFPLANELSAPEKLMRDLEKAKQVRTQMCFKIRFCKNFKKIHDNNTCQEPCSKLNCNFDLFP